MNTNQTKECTCGCHTSESSSEDMKKNGCDLCYCDSEYYPRHPKNKSTNEGHPVKNYCRVCHKETEQIFNIHGTPAYICPDCESLIVKQSVVYNYSNKQND